MTHYRTEADAKRATITTDSDTGEDVLVHVACADKNPEAIAPWGGDYTYKDGDCCAVCGNDLAHEVV